MSDDRHPSGIPPAAGADPEFERLRGHLRGRRGFDLAGYTRAGPGSAPLPGDHRLQAAHGELDVAAEAVPEEAR